VTFLVSTTQRCGSTWVTRILEEILGTGCYYLDCNALGFKLSAESDGEAHSRLVAALRSRATTCVFKTHDLPSKDFDAVCSTISELKIITMNRDFKDVAISRYFYYRYYWPTEPALGRLPPHLANFFSKISDLSDGDAISFLLEDPVLLGWLREWRAFESSFHTPRAIRLNYAKLLDGSETKRLERFVGCPCPRGKSFSTIQELETAQTGRNGNARFNREGRAGGWKGWLSLDQAIVIDQLCLSGQFK
jgi:hypothetical protein